MKQCVKESCREAVQSNTEPRSTEVFGMLWSFLSWERTSELSCAGLGRRAQETGEHYCSFFFALAAVDYSLNSSALALGKALPVHYSMISSEELHLFLLGSLKEQKFLVLDL